MFDGHRNFAYSTVTIAPNTALLGSFLTIATGAGALFPTPPFNATVWPVNTQALVTNSEIVRVTGLVGDTMYITRAQEGTSGRAIGLGDAFANTISVKVATDIEGAVNLVSGETVRLGGNQFVSGDKTFAANLTFASGMGFAPTGVNASLVALGQRVFYTNSNPTSSTFLLPPLASTTGATFLTKNKGASITFTGAFGDRIFGSYESLTFTMNSGEAYQFINDGTHWCVL